MRAALTGISLLTMLLPAPLAAQERFALDLRAGRAVPVGQLASVSASGITSSSCSAVRDAAVPT